MATTRSLMMQLNDMKLGRRTRKKETAKLKKKKKKEDGGGSPGEMHVTTDPVSDGPRPVGDPTIQSKADITRYAAFQFAGRRYHLEDTVLVTPVEETKKPDVAIIKGIIEALNGSMSVKVQWLYRPEQLDSDDRSSVDSRELLITDHQEEVPAESIMHNCVVHFLPDSKKLPDRKKHPGFVVLHFYDHLKQKVYKLTDGDYMGLLQKENYLRIQETKRSLGWKAVQQTMT